LKLAQKYRQETNKHFKKNYQAVPESGNMKRATVLSKIIVYKDSLKYRNCSKKQQNKL
jgi:hypothetical protein